MPLSEQERVAWRVAFAEQALSEFRAREVLLDRSGKLLPPCHHLHLLQMGMEKAAKAFLIWRGADPKEVTQKHAYVATTVPQIVRHYFSRGRNAGGERMMADVRRVAEKIDSLHPSVERDVAPGNCE